MALLSFNGPDYNQAFNDVVNFVDYAGDKIGTFVDNQLTGELDYNRQLELQDRANAFTASESAKARQYNAEQAQLQRDFEERLSNSAYSRAFADMRRNGINPYAIMQGASTPSGAVASSSGARGATPTTNSSGKALMSFLANFIGSAFAFAGRAVQARTKLGTRQYFNADGESIGGFTDYY